MGYKRINTTRDILARYEQAHLRGDYDIAASLARDILFRGIELLLDAHQGTAAQLTKTELDCIQKKLDAQKETAQRHANLAAVAWSLVLIGGIALFGVLL